MACPSRILKPAIAFFRLGDYRLLASDFCQVRYGAVHDFLVRHRFAHTHIERDFGDAGNLHGRLEAKLGDQIRSDFLAVVLL